nr:MAG TPA: hypothetical protein [Caudoviricetes sp.]
MIIVNKKRKAPTRLCSVWVFNILHATRIKY